MKLTDFQTGVRYMVSSGDVVSQKGKSWAVSMASAGACIAAVLGADSSQAASVLCTPHRL